MRHIKFVATYLELSALLGSLSDLGSLGIHYSRSIAFEATGPDYPYLGG